MYLIVSAELPLITLSIAVAKKTMISSLQLLPVTVTVMDGRRWVRCTSCRFSYVSYLFFSVNVSALFKFVLQPRSVLGLRVLSLYAKMANGINFSFPPNGARGPFYVLERKFERTDDARTEEGGNYRAQNIPSRLLRYYIPSI